MFDDLCGFVFRVRHTLHLRFSIIVILEIHVKMVHNEFTHLSRLKLTNNRCLSQIFAFVLKYEIINSAHIKLHCSHTKKSKLK